MCTCIHAWCYCVLHADMRWARAGAEAPLLADVNLMLPPHAMGLVYGRSGAGKTTLLQARVLAAAPSRVGRRAATPRCCPRGMRLAHPATRGEPPLGTLEAQRAMQPRFPGRLSRVTCHVAACQSSNPWVWGTVLSGKRGGVPDRAGPRCLQLLAGLTQPSSGRIAITARTAGAGAGGAGAAPAAQGGAARPARASLVFQFPERHFLGVTLQEARPRTTPRPRARRTRVGALLPARTCRPVWHAVGSAPRRLLPPGQAPASLPRALHQRGSAAVCPVLGQAGARAQEPALGRPQAQAPPARRLRRPGQARAPWPPCPPLSNRRAARAGARVWVAAAECRARPARRGGRGGAAGGGPGRRAAGRAAAPAQRRLPAARRARGRAGAPPGPAAAGRAAGGPGLALARGHCRRAGCARRPDRRRWVAGWSRVGPANAGRDARGLGWRARVCARSSKMPDVARRLQRAPAHASGGASRKALQLLHTQRLTVTAATAAIESSSIPSVMHSICLSSASGTQGRAGARRQRHDAALR